jgi:hypothetical protein
MTIIILDFNILLISAIKVEKILIKLLRRDFRNK